MAAIPTTVKPRHSRLIRKMSRDRVVCGFFSPALPFLRLEWGALERLGVLCRFMLALTMRLSNIVPATVAGKRCRSTGNLRPAIQRGMDTSVSGRYDVLIADSTALFINRQYEKIKMGKGE